MKHLVLILLAPVLVTSTSAMASVAALPNAAPEDHAIESDVVDSGWTEFSDMPDPPAIPELPEMPEMNDFSSDTAHTEEFRGNRSPAVIAPPVYDTAEDDEAL